MGRAKALVAGSSGIPWVVSASRVLREGGCDPVVVVVGAVADDVRSALEPEDVRVVEAHDWAEGMGASLRAGLRSIAGLDGDAVLVHLVDLPDVGADVVRRMVAHSAPDVLARADYGRGPGHPVLIGRAHWAGVTTSAHGDTGAREHLAQHGSTAVDCSDLATGQDVDSPPSA